MKLKGWKTILAFTYMQTVRSKAFKAGTAIVCVLTMLLCAAINILPALIAGDGGSMFGDTETTDPEEPISVNTLYIYTVKELPFALPLDEKAEYVTVEAEDAQDKLTEITGGEKPEMFLAITGEDGFVLSFYRPEDESVLPKNTADEFSEQFTESFTKLMYLSIGVSGEDIALARSGVYSYVQVYDQKSEIQQVLEIVIPMVLAFVFYMFIMLYSQQIATSMATEKSSRVIELLITSARPLAIITGKIAGTLLVCITQVAIFGAAGGLAFAVTAPFGISAAVSAAPAIGEAVSMAGDITGAVDIGAELAAALPGAFNAGSIIAVILTLILGFLFYALLAGLVGASVSRLEDLAGAMQPLMLIAVFGFMLAYIPSTMFGFEGDLSGIITFSHYFPISSPFALPTAILMGGMGTAETVIAVAMLAIMTLLAAMLTAKVYEGMILYSGNRLKFAQILKMAKK